jgi:hypothetical protein
MTAYDRFEMKTASALLAMMQFWMALVLVFANGGDPLSRALRQHDIAGIAALVMIGLSAMTFMGSVRPMRALRHWGLAGTSIVAWYLITLSFQERALFGMTAGCLLLLTTGSFVLLAVDAVKGAREERHGPQRSG